jgi:hypothetical protein
VRPGASGAAATIASDALMNPFDGMRRLSGHGARRLTSGSHQTTHASTWLDSQNNLTMREVTVPKRRALGILRVIPDHSLHDCPVHGDTVHGIRLAVENHEPEEGVRSDRTLRGWRARWCIRSWNHDTMGCDQDIASDARNEPGARNPERWRAAQCCQNHQASIWLEWVHARVETEDNYDDAEHCYLLVNFHSLAYLKLY